MTSVPDEESRLNNAEQGYVPDAFSPSNLHVFGFLEFECIQHPCLLSVQWWVLTIEHI